MTGIRAIIVDIDGTIARNNTGRPWYGEGFEKRVHEDDVDRTVAHVIDSLLHSSYFTDHVLFVTGRMEVAREATTNWLCEEANYIVDEDPVSLFMRKDGDFRPDTTVKREIYDEHIRDVYDVRLALDDKPELIDLWRSLGIPAWQVNEYR